MSAVSDGALIARINRRLAKDGERLRVARGRPSVPGYIPPLGNFYIVDLRTNAVTAYGYDSLHEVAKVVGAA